MADRPVVNPQSRPVAPQVGATVHNYGGPRVSLDAQVDGLLQGLSNFNRGITALTGTQITRDAKTAEMQGAADAAAGKESDPDAAPFAFGEHYAHAYQTAINTKTAIQSQQDYLDAFSQEMHKPDFNPDTFSKTWWGDQLSGAQDPDLVLRMEDARLKADSVVRNQWRAHLIQKATDAEKEATSTLLAATVRDRSGEEIGQAFVNDVVPQLQQQGLYRLTGPERMEALLQAVRAESLRRGGVPELFNAFNVTNPASGKPLKDQNAQLALAIEGARKEADDLRERNVREENQQWVARTQASIENDIRTGQADTYLKDGPEALIGLIGPTGFSREQALGLWHEYLKSKLVVDELASVRPLMDRGALWRVDDKIQAKALDGVFSQPRPVASGGAPGEGETQLGPSYIDKLEIALANGDVVTATEVGNEMVAIHKQYGATAPAAALQRMLKNVSLDQPGKDGEVPRNFAAASALYKALSVNPTLQSMYFPNDNVRRSIEVFNQRVAGQSDPTAAYAVALKAADPEAYAKARKSAEGDPAVREKVKKDIAKSVQGAQWWWFGNKAENTEALINDWTQFATALKLGNPDLSEAELETQRTEFFQRNYILVTDGLGKNVGLRMPDGFASKQASEAFNAFTTQLHEQFRIEARGGGDWTNPFSVTVVADKNNPGTFQFYASRNGVPVDGPVIRTYEQIMETYRSKTFITADDRKQLVDFAAKVNAGTVTAQELEAARPLIAKVRTQGAGKLPAEVTKAYTQASEMLFNQAQARDLKLPEADLSTDHVADPAPAAIKGARVDMPATKQAALMYVDTSRNGKDYRLLAKGLITARETIALQRHADPNKKAGDNIGIGYNLKANAKTVHDDLVKAGVPKEHVQGVIDGNIRMTPKQTLALLEKTFPKYEAMAIKAVESAKPGGWQSLPANVKAVIIDTAYQSGAPEKFKESIQKALKGESTDIFQVRYDRDGQMVEDARGNQLRSNMLAGIGRFRAVLAKGGA